MKKILTITLLVMALLTAGCGTFNFFVMPSDAEFIEIVQDLDTPKKICGYMTDNFEYIRKSPGLYTPYETYILKTGNCNDFAYFGRFIANYHGYEIYWIRIFFTTGKTCHIIGIYIEDEEYNYSTNLTYCPIKASNFRDCVLDYFLHYTKKELMRYAVYNYKDIRIDRGYK